MPTAASSEVGLIWPSSTSSLGEDSHLRVTIPTVVETDLATLVWKAQLLSADHRPTPATVTGPSCANNGPITRPKYPIGSKWQHQRAVTQSLYKTGPLSVLLDASGLQFYKSGVFSPRSCSSTDLNHAVLLVGYNSTGSTSYYSVKNSWGPEWGENGYFNIMRSVGETGPGTCGIQSFVTSSIV